MKSFFLILALLAMTSAALECPIGSGAQNQQSAVGSVASSNTCITFSVTQGTGCAWMCNYCVNNLGTNNYYFTSGVCTYNPNLGYCVGNPLAGVQYTCCSL